jgi:hypothetical protein
MVADKALYDVLGVEPHATQEQITRVRTFDNVFERQFSKKRVHSFLSK